MKDLNNLIQLIRKSITHKPENAKHYFLFHKTPTLIKQLALQWHKFKESEKLFFINNMDRSEINMLAQCLGFEVVKSERRDIRDYIIRELVEEAAFLNTKKLLNKKDRDLKKDERISQSYISDSFNLSPIDIAIVTILSDEYMAVINNLENSFRPPPDSSRPDSCAWMIGEVKSSAYRRPYRVVVSMAEKKGEISGTNVTRNTVERWNPKYVVLVGIAGGLPRKNLELGDVVVSNAIWGYEYGKVIETFDPRPDYVYQVDNALLRNASALAKRESRWKTSLSKPEQKKSYSPKVVVGPVASGDKIIDDARSEFFQKVLEKWPKLIAIEMEGAGAAAAIAELQSLRYLVGFIMIRGISDMPPAEMAISQEKANNKIQTNERDMWKKTASDAAAAFTVHFIRNAWPLSPE